MNDQIGNVSVESRERGERLRRIRNLANLSRKMLCDAAEININTYIGYEVGRYGGLTLKGADKVIHCLSSKGVYCSLAWLMHGVGKGPEVITDTDLISASDSYLDVISEEQKIRNELNVFRDHYKDAVDRQIIDDGMLPTYEIGSYVAGVPVSKSSIANILGSDCIVQLKSGEMMVRNLREGRVQGAYILTCTNPDTSIYEPILYDVKLAYAAKIIWHRRLHRPE